MQKIPLTILAGFLGAGKTTLLNRILSADHGTRVAVLVNDFGEINIDSQLITSVEGETISLANGCICCTIRQDLVQAVVELLARPEPPQYIVTESSGVSDPAEVAMGFALSSKLAIRIAIDAIVTLVDAEHVLDLRDSDRHLATDQVHAADIVIINKTDLVSAGDADAIRSWLSEAAPQARVIEAVNADVSLDMIFAIGAHSPERILNSARAPHDRHAHDERYATWSWEQAQPLAFEAVYEAFKTLPLEVFRAKGILNVREVPGKRVIVQMVGKRVTLSGGEAWGTTPARSQIVAIGPAHAIDPGELETRFAACRAVGPPAVDNPLAQAVIQVLRRSG